VGTVRNTSGFQYRLVALLTASVVSIASVGAQPAGAQSLPPSEAARQERPTVIVEQPTGGGLSESQLQELVGRNSSAAGPAIVAGPGEAATTDAITLPPGSASATALTSIDSAEKASPTGKDGENIPDRVVPPGPDEKVNEKAKEKRKKKFDGDTSKRKSRKVGEDQFGNADGSTTALVGGRNNAVDASGEIVDSDPAIVLDPSGKLRKRSGAVRSEFALELKAGSEIATVTGASGKVGFIPQGLAPGVRKGRVKDSSVAYDDAFGPGVDIEFVATDTGVKENIILKSLPAAGQPVEFRSLLNAPGLTPVVNKNGSVSLLDATGKEQWIIPPGVQYELAAGEASAQRGAVAFSLERVKETVILVSRPDEQWLRDPSRRFPVVVDPTLLLGKDAVSNPFAQVQEDVPSGITGGCGSSDGFCTGRTILVGSGLPSGRKYSYVRYDQSAARGKILNSAFLRLKSASGGCASYPATVTVWPVASPWDGVGLSWNTRPAVRPVTVVGSINAAGTVSFDVSGWAAKYASGEWPDYGFQVDSSTYCGWLGQGVGSSFLELTYTDPAPGSNRPPQTPILTSPALNASVPSPVTLSATASDPDGDSLQFFFSSTLQTSPFTTVSSGWTSSNSWQTPALASGSWKYSVSVTDGITAPVLSAEQAFVVVSSASSPQESTAWGTTGQYSAIAASSPGAGVNTGTKRFVHVATDAKVAVAGPAVAIQRTYNSGDADVGAFGRGFTSILDTSVFVDGNQNLTFKLPDGRREYHPLVNGVYRTAPGYWTTAASDGSGGWTLLEKDGTLWRFGTTGRLKSVVDRNGRSLSLIDDANTGKPSAIQEGVYFPPRKLTLTWTGSFVTSVSDGTNAPWNYAYSGSNLAKVCDPRNNNVVSGSCTTYTYDAANQIIGIVKPKGNFDVQVGYYPDGTVSSQRDGMNNQTSFAYNPTTRTSTTTDPLGRQTVEVFNTSFQNVSRTEPGDGNIPAHTMTVTYDSNGFMASMTSPTTGTWTYVNDYRGNQVEVTDPTGAKSFYSFDSRDLLIAYRDARSANSLDNTYRWTYGYDANGNRVRQTNPFGWSRTWTYATGNTKPASALLQEQDWNGNVTSYTYEPIRGDLQSVTNPGVSGDSMTYTYDALGNKTNETGVIAAPGITYTYDALNAPLTITEPPVTNPIDGMVHRKKTTFTYDANRLLSSKVEADIGGSASPDPTRTTTYTYDNADRQLSMTNPQGGINSQTYTAVGTVDTTTDPNGRITRTVFNARNLPQSQTAVAYDDPTDAVAPADRTLQTMTYDAAGRMVSQTDANGRLRTMTYDGMNRMLARSLIGFVDRNGVSRNIVEQVYEYDKVGNTVSDRKGNDALSEVNVWDAAGRQVAHGNLSQPRNDYFGLDRNGNVTNWEHQTTGNVVQSRKLTTYDPRNRPLGATVDMLGVTPNRTMTYSYTKWGSAATVIDAKGNTTTFGHDVLGRQITQTAPVTSHEDVGGTAVASAAVITQGYDSFGNVTATKDPRGAITKFTYDKLNRKTRTDQASCTTACSVAAAYETTTFDGNGNRTATRDRRGQVNDFTFDTLNRPVRQLLPSVGGAARAQVLTHYDLKGNVVDSTSQIGAFTSITYNEMDLPKTVNSVERYPSAQTATVTFDYNNLRQKIWQRDPLGAVTTFEYLATGEQSKLTDPASAIWQATYDGLGRKTAEYDPLNRATKTIFNAASEPVTSQRTDNSGTMVTQTSVAYDANGNATASTDGRGFITTYSYDPMNRLSGVTVPNGASPMTTTYGYDRTSNMTRTTNGKGVATTYTFNQWNLQAALVEPATTAFPAIADRTFTTTYDAGGLPVGSGEPGISVTRTFNELGYLTNESGTGTGIVTAARTYGRDVAGRITSVNASNGNFAFTYNDKNQVILGTGGGAANSTFTYDIKGRMTTKTDHTSSYSPQTYLFGYSSRDELSSARDQRTPVRTSSFNSAGELTAVTQGTTTRSYAYDSIGRMASDSLKNASGAVLNSASFAYDGNDNVTSRTIAAAGNAGAGVHTYTYDQTNRLSSWTRPGVAAVNYAYDAAGNRTQDGTATYTYDQRNQVLSGPSQTYSWTARGTLASQVVGGVTTSYRTDGLDRPDRVVRGTTTVDWKYDGLDRLNSRLENNVQTHWFAYAGLESDPVTYTAPGGGQDNNRGPSGSLSSVTSASGVATVGLDRHGDLTHLFDSNAATVSSTGLYEPYGKQSTLSGVAPVANRLGFQGDWTDPLTGDVLMGARWYNPTTGSFRTRDTYAGKPTNPVTQNRTAYGNNNPMSFSDPSGRNAAPSGFSPNHSIPAGTMIPFMCSEGCSYRPPGSTPPPGRYSIVGDDGLFEARNFPWSQSVPVASLNATYWSQVDQFLSNNPGGTYFSRLSADRSASNTYFFNADGTYFSSLVWDPRITFDRAPVVTTPTPPRVDAPKATPLPTASGTGVGSGGGEGSSGGSTKDDATKPTFEIPNVKWTDFNIVGGCVGASAGFILGASVAHCELQSAGTAFSSDTVGFGFAFELGAGGGVFVSNARSIDDLGGFANCNAFSQGPVSVEICILQHGRISVFGGRGFSGDVWAEILANVRFGGHVFLSYTSLAIPKFVAPSWCDFHRSDPSCGTPGLTFV
jgi:RHS repeat-associated protein